MNDILKITDLNVKYQTQDSEINAIENISFTVANGELVCIIGPSGCGKSTLLSAIANLIAPAAGEILINGKDIRTSSVVIGYMPQKDSLFEWRNIYENITLGLEIRNIKTKENLDYVDHMLNTYGLYEFKYKYPNQLSGGMRQRCALIRTLVIKPEILLLDEAFSALDYQTRLAVVDDIYTIIRKENKTAIMVTHDISESISVSDRIIVLSKRPAIIKSIHTIKFEAENLTPFHRREQPEFRNYFNRIWRDIDVYL